MFSRGGSIYQSQAVLIADGHPDLIRRVFVRLTGRYRGDVKETRLRIHGLLLLRGGESGLSALRSLEVLGVITEQPDIHPIELVVQLKGNFHYQQIIDAGLVGDESTVRSEAGAESAGRDRLARRAAGRTL